MDTKKIECLDWCEYVYRSLKSSVSEWQGGSAFFTGPLPFLMICYFDRLQRSKISNPRQFPLLSVWKKDLIKERMKLEMKRGFGKGHVLDRMEVDRHDNNVSQVAGDPELGGSDVSGSNEMLEFLQKFGTLAKKLAENLSEIHAMLDKANEIFAKEEASDMNTFIQNIWNKYSMRREEKQKDNPSILSQDKHLFDEPAFIKELDDVMKRSWEKFKGKKKTPLEMTPPSFDLKGNVGKREKICPENLPNCIRSPFMVQYDNIFKKVDGHKKRMEEYAFANGLPNEILYDDGQTTIRRDEMSSLAANNHVFNNIVDAWSFILNIENRRRTPGSTNRLFFSTQAYEILCTNYHFSPTVKIQDRYHTLFERLKKEMKHSKVQNFDRVHLLRAFAMFLSTKRSKCDQEVSSFKTRTLKMSWRTNDNNDDCGVFLLKHMETYHGEKDTNWESGIKLNDINQTKKLRVDFCAKILSHKENELHHEITSRSWKWAKENSL
uniref:Ubiquitin-like protease family profile domain-containing protein n=1 Tax=Chenopodium quinoa TaxID=63459 RepID=A0A803N7X6_CHEQI